MIKENSKSRVISKTLLLTVVASLVIVSSLLLATIGSTIVRASVVPQEELSKDIAIVICMLSSIHVAIYSINSSNIILNILKSLLFMTTLSLILSLIIRDVSFISNVLFSGLFTFTLILPSFLLIKLSISIMNTLNLYVKNLNVNHMNNLFLVASSFLISHNFANPPYINFILFTRLTASILTAYISILCIIIGQLKDSKSRLKETPLSSNLHLLAIALCTFGNTSFHNKDLSHVDFTNIDLANIDLRAQNFYRTCFRGATGLDRSRLDNRYFDIDNPKVQQLLTQGTTIDRNLNGLNLQGAYLKDGRMSDVSLIETNLTGSDLISSDLCNSNLLRANLSGADLQAANLQNCILLQTDLTGANLTGANLTGACIENWNINGRTNLTDVQCDYIYRKLDDSGRPTDRIPLDRNFDPGEFASIYQDVENVVELIFKEGINWRAFAFSLQKLQIDDEGLGLQLRGIEKRGDFWVVKVTHDSNVPSTVVEQKLGATYETLQRSLAAKEQQINQLLGIVTNQSEALRELSKKPFGNQFNITGSTITNLAGSGQIDYAEAANQVRNLVAAPSNTSKSNQIAQELLSQIQNQQLLAPTDREKAELICQIILTESEKDPVFRQFILQQSTNLLTAIPEGPIAIAFQTALESLNS